MFTAYVIYTDTFNGEPNYGFVRREQFPVFCNQTNREIMNKALRVLDLADVPGTLEAHGTHADELAFIPDGVETIVLVSIRGD